MLFNWTLKHWVAELNVAFCFIKASNQNNPQPSRLWSFSTIPLRFRAKSICTTSLNIHQSNCFKTSNIVYKEKKRKRESSKKKWTRINFASDAICLPKLSNLHNPIVNLWSFVRNFKISPVRPTRGRSKIPSDYILRVEWFILLCFGLRDYFTVTATVISCFV